MKNRRTEQKSSCGESPQKQKMRGGIEVFYPFSLAGGITVENRQNVLIAGPASNETRKKRNSNSRQESIKRGEVLGK